MEKLNNSDIDKVSGGVLSIQKNSNGEYDIISTDIVTTCKTEDEAKKMIDKYAEIGAHRCHHRGPDGGTHVRPGKFEHKPHHGHDE